MRVVFTMYGVGIAGGVRAIFKVADGLLGRGHDVGIVALGGDHPWTELRTSIYYVEMPSELNRLLTIYKVLRDRFRKRYTALATESFIKELISVNDSSRIIGVDLGYD